MRLFALQGQTLFAPRFRSAQPWAHAHNPAPPRGVGDAAPYNTIRRASHYRKRPRRPGGRPPYIPLYHIPWGGPSPATHSRHPVGAGHARPATLPLPPRILCIVGRGLDPSAGRWGRRPLQRQTTGLRITALRPQTKISCPRPLAGRLFLCFKFFSVPFLLRKGTTPAHIKITSGRSPQPRRTVPATPAGSGSPSGR